MPPENDALVAALRVALKASDVDLANLQDDLARLSLQARELSDRIVKAQQTRNSILKLLEEQGERDPRPRLAELAAASRKREELRRDDDELDAAYRAMSKSAQEAVLILMSAAGPLRPVEVLREFEAHGLVHPDWKAPAQSIYGALKRAEQSGFVRRTGDGRWELAIQGLHLVPKPGIKFPIIKPEALSASDGSRAVQGSPKLPRIKGLSRPNTASSRNRDDDEQDEEGE
jgi:hypothetical protein